MFPGFISVFTFFVSSKIFFLQVLVSCTFNDLWQKVL